MSVETDRGFVSGSCHDKPMTLINPDLKGLYTRIYSDEPWPVPLPRPEKVCFGWNPRFETTSGGCSPKEKIIEVNVIYRDRSSVESSSTS